MSAISLTDIRCVIDRVPLLDSITFSVEPSEILWISGPAGSGKTLLFQILHGLRPYQGGLYRFEGEVVETKADRYRIRRAISAVYEDLNLIESESVIENLFLAGLSDLNSMPLMKLAIERLVDRFELRPILDHRVANVSFAQKKLVALVRAIARSSKLVLADEPFLGFEEPVLSRIWDEFVRMAVCGRSVIIFSASLPTSGMGVRRTYSLTRGRIQEKALISSDGIRASEHNGHNGMIRKGVVA